MFATQNSAKNRGIFYFANAFSAKFRVKKSAWKYLQHKTSAKKCVRKCLPQKVLAENRDIFDLQMFAARNSGRESRNFWFANVCSASFRPTQMFENICSGHFRPKMAGFRVANTCNAPIRPKNSILKCL